MYLFKIKKKVHSLYIRQFPVPSTIFSIIVSVHRLQSLTLGFPQKVDWLAGIFENQSEHQIFFSSIRRTQWFIGYKTYRVRKLGGRRRDWYEKFCRRWLESTSATATGTRNSRVSFSSFFFSSFFLFSGTSPPITPLMTFNCYWGRCWPQVGADPPFLFFSFFLEPSMCQITKLSLD